MDELDKAEIMFKAGIEYALCSNKEMLRLARHENGEVYVGKTEYRSDYGDETVAWIETDLDYVQTGQLIWSKIKDL